MHFPPVFFTPDEAAKNSARFETSTASDARYRVVKYCTIALDYAMLLGYLLYCNEHYAGDNFSPRAAAVCGYILVGMLYFVEVIKVIAFRDVLPKVKVDHAKGLWKELVSLFTPGGLVKTFKFLLKLCAGEGIIRNFRDKGTQRKGVLYHLFYFIKNFAIFYAGLVRLKTSFCDGERHPYCIRLLTSLCLSNLLCYAFSCIASSTSAPW